MTPNTHFNQVLSKFELRRILLFDGRWTCASVEIGESKARAQNKDQSESISIDVYLDLIKKRSPVGQHIRTCVVWNKFQIRFNVNIYWNGIALRNTSIKSTLLDSICHSSKLFHYCIQLLDDWMNEQINTHSTE